MRNCLIVFLFFIQTVGILAQEFHGTAIYVSKDNIPGLNFDDNSNDAKKKLHERISDASRQFYILDFNKTESVYLEELALRPPGSKMTVTRTSSALEDQSGKIYKDIKNKILLVEKDFLGKSFLVSDTLHQLQWNLKNETKKIGNYLCYKAIAEIPANEAENFIRKNMKTNSKTIITATDLGTTTVTAWYTPDIPISQGPKSYWGLPGLILEINTPATTILCSKITLTTKDNFIIKIPVKGKKVTIDEYSQIILNKLQEMENME